MRDRLSRVALFRSPSEGNFSLKRYWSDPRHIELTRLNNIRHCHTYPVDKPFENISPGAIPASQFQQTPRGNTAPSHHNANNSACSNVSGQTLVCLSGPDGIVTDFSTLDLFEKLPESVPREIIFELKRSGMTLPNALQRTAIPLLLEKNALIVRASTGMGKTVSICICIAARLSSLISRKQYDSTVEVDRNSTEQLVKKPPVVVLTSSALRVQYIFEAMRTMGKSMQWKGCALYPGVDTEQQQSTADSKGYDFIISTPDYLKRRHDMKLMRLDNLNCVFLDEADQMMANRMEHPMETIFQSIPREAARFVFAESYSFALQEFLGRHFPEKIMRLEAISEVGHASPYTHRFFITENAHDKVQFITKLLNEGVISRENRAIIFANQRTDIRDLYQRFAVFTKPFRVYVRSLSNEMPPNTRKESISFIDKGNGKILIATDAALKSIESPVNIIINYELPPDGIYGFERRCNYTGKYGTIYTFIDKQTKPVIAQEIIDFLKKTEQPIPDELKKILETNAHLSGSTQSSNERKIGTQGTFDWIRQTAKEEEKKEVKTFVTRKNTSSRNIFVATVTPRNKGKGLPTIRF